MCFLTKCFSRVAFSLFPAAGSGQSGEKPCVGLFIPIFPVTVLCRDMPKKLIVLVLFSIERVCGEIKTGLRGEVQRRAGYAFSSLKKLLTAEIIGFDLKLTYPELYFGKRVHLVALAFCLKSPYSQAPTKTSLGPKRNHLNVHRKIVLVFTGNYLLL